MKDYACDDKDELVAFLYDELGADARRAVEAHLAACHACAGEVHALSDVRQELGAWLPPEAELDFTIVQKSATVLRPPRWRTPALPAWAQVAAAVLVLAAGAALANLHVRYDNTGLSVATGWKSVVPTSPGASATPAQAEAAAGVTSDAAWRSALSSLEADLRGEMQMLRQARPAVGASPTGATVSEAALLKRVQSLLDASEQRQRQEFALRLTQFERDVELQRRADLVRIQQGVGQLEGRTGAEVARQRELLNYLVRVSGRQVVPE